MYRTLTRLKPNACKASSAGYVETMGRDLTYRMEHGSRGFVVRHIILTRWLLPDLESPLNDQERGRVSGDQTPGSDTKTGHNLTKLDHDASTNRFALPRAAEEPGGD